MFFPEQHIKKVADGGTKQKPEIQFRKSSIHNPAKSAKIIENNGAVKEDNKTEFKVRHAFQSRSQATTINLNNKENKIWPIVFPSLFSTQY